MKSAIIELEKYDPNWVLKFETEKTFLLKIIGEWLQGSVEHVGSTAVPELIAKPVIDIMFGVKSLEDSKSAIDLLNSNGYCYAPYKTDKMHWFCKPSDQFRTHHLHLIPFQSDLWQERIKFRDILRNNQKVADEYAYLKIKLTSKNKEDREAYTQQKWPFVENILKNY